MRRGTRLVMTVATTAVAAVAYRAGAQPRAVSGTASSQPTIRPSATQPTATPRRTTPTATPTTRPRVTASTRTPAPSSTPLTVAGDVVDTQYGPVQVEITVRAGRITKARALRRPSGDGQTDQINGYAIPQLDRQAVAAQSAQLDTVSGATFTSDGYSRSLQSAIDAVHRSGAR
ncbi:FMN-binding protein [Kribbella sp. NPDC026611]|uniref:FMN-binding protein n=1 Tax=Kribbella sp. NPDC026611 TaxID=3154911 RepID=UPI0033CD3315